MTHPQQDEVTSLLQALCDNGFKLVRVVEGSDED